MRETRQRELDLGEPLQLLVLAVPTLALYLGQRLPDAAGLAGWLVAGSLGAVAVVFLVATRVLALRG